MPSSSQIIERLIPGVEHQQNRYARELAAVVQPGRRWLDIGAGTRLHDGWVGLRQEEVATRAAVLIGCDMLPEHLAQNPYLTAAAAADAAQLPFASASFDLVTANMVLEHLEDPLAVFSEIARVLAPRGRFVFVTPNRTSPLVFMASVVLTRPARKALAMLVEKRAPEEIFHTFYRANSPTALRRLAARSGLSVRRLEPFHSLPFDSPFWPLVAIQALWIRMVSRGPLRVLSDDLFGEMEKEG